MCIMIQFSRGENVVLSLSLWDQRQNITDLVIARLNFSIMTNELIEFIRNFDYLDNDLSILLLYATFYIYK